MVLEPSDKLEFIMYVAVFPNELLTGTEEFVLDILVMYAGVVCRNTLV